MQKTSSDDLARVLHTAAWIWLGYLFALMAVDAYMYASIPSPFSALSRYYVGNVGIALIFLAFSYWPPLQKKLNGFYVPLMLFIIAGLPIAFNRYFIPHFPPGPMSSVEGSVLRSLPILFIGLVITAWCYSWPWVAVYAMGTAVFEIVILQFFPQPRVGNSVHAITFVSIVRSISFMVVGYFISRLMRQLQAQQEQLSAANMRLSHYASTLEQLTVSRERNRMARELHDTLAHTLSALSVQLETVKAYWSVEPDTAQGLLDQSLAATRSGLNETRRALKALRAAPLEDLGLGLAIRKLGETAVSRSNLTLNLSVPEQIPALSPDVEQCLYRIAQEAIENVVYHANAQNLTVKLAFDGDGVLLLVQDDGTGFRMDQAPSPGHYGLAGMRERAQLAGGELLINGRLEEGTTIKLTILLPYTF